MELQNTALVAAGIIGSSVAVMHGIVEQRRMVERLQPHLRADERLAGPVTRLVPLLLHFSTFNWFVGGLALIASAIWFSRDVKLATGLLVGNSYMFGAIGNAWGTSGRHPGWILYAAALALILFGIG